eukprot:scaffold84168_cov39-Attheya_sp.AAC.5
MRHRRQTTRRGNDEAIPVVKNVSSASSQKRSISTTEFIGNFRDGNSHFSLTHAPLLLWTKKEQNLVLKFSINCAKVKQEEWIP